MKTNLGTYLVGLLGFLGVVVALPSSAAEFYFGSVSHTVRVGDTFAIGVFLNSEGDDLNTFSGALSIPGALSVTDVRFEDSFVSFWVERPTASNDIRFAGAIPGGYTGTDGLLFSVVARAIEVGRATIDARDMVVLLDDGSGTRAPVRSSPLIMTVTLPAPENEATEGVAAGPIAWEAPIDSDPPEPFTPEIARDPSLFGGGWFLVFFAHDKGSGIDHYEVIESRRALDPDRPDLAWTTRDSLVVLRDQGLRSYLYVKAIDRAGNHRVAVVLPENTPLLTYASYAVSGILLGGLAILGFFIRFRLRRFTASIERHVRH